MRSISSYEWEIELKYYHFATLNEIMDSQISCATWWNTTYEVLLPKNWTWILSDV